MKNSDVEFVYKKIKDIYPLVEIQKPIPFPKNTYYQPRNRYRADSIIAFLSLKAVPKVIILGLTSKDISATRGKNPDFGIMGLGYRPGNACVASSFRLSKKNCLEQLYKVAIHEIGHTQGLPHCSDKACFMRDAEGKNPTDEEKDFCEKCKSLLKSKNWNLPKKVGMKSLICSPQIA